MNADLPAKVFLAGIVKNLKFLKHVLSVVRTTVNYYFFLNRNCLYDRSDAGIIYF